MATNKKNPHKTALADYLIQKCIDKKEKTLDLGMCGLTDWPDEVCEMHWLEELNFRNYTYDEDAWNFEKFNKGKWIQRNDEYRTKYFLIRNHIRQLPGGDQIKKMKNLKRLSIGGGKNPVISENEYWALEDVGALMELNQLTEVQITYSAVSDLTFLSYVKTIRKLNLTVTAISDFDLISSQKDLESLNLQNTRVSNLGFLMRLGKLKYLNLSNTTVASISDLFELQNLESLNLSRTEITEFPSRVPDFNLLSLDISNTQVSELSWLSRHPHLSSLNLSRTAIVELDSFLGSTKLEYLDLGHVRINEITSLSGAINLRWLNLAETDVYDLSPVKRLIHLKFLDLSNCSVLDVSSISGLSKLEFLNLGKTNSHRLDWISDLVNIKSLNLEYNERLNLDSVSRLKYLEHLNISWCNISNIKELSGNTRLRALIIRGNSVSDFSILKELVELRSLDVSRTAFEKMRDLVALESLRTLNLEGTQILDVSDLSSFISLRRVYLIATPISEISAFSKLKGLQVLDLGNTKVSDVSALSSVLALQQLNLYKTSVSDISPLKDVLKKPHVEIFKKYAQNGIIVSEYHQNVPPIETIERGIEQVLLYFEQQRTTGAKLISNKEAKLVLLGNSTAGKTSLLTYLSTNVEERASRIYKSIYTTHGIQEEIWKPKDLKVERESETLENLTIRVLDFGGHEYYHDCHHLFFTNRTAYVVIWEKDTNRHFTKLTEQKKKNGAIFREPTEHFGLEYWLEAIGFFTKLLSLNNDEVIAKTTAFVDQNVDWEKIRPKVNKTLKYYTSVDLQLVFARALKSGTNISDALVADLKEVFDDYVVIDDLIKSYATFLEHSVYSAAPTLITQNKTSKDGVVFLNQSGLKSRFPFIHDFSEVDVRQNIAMHHLEHFQLKNLLKNLPILGEKIFDFYARVDDELLNHKEVVIPRSDFDRTFFRIVTTETKATKSYERLVKWAKFYLDYRLDTGKLLYYPDSKDEVLRNQIIIKPYEMINRFYAILNRDLENKRGEFSYKDAQKALKKHLGAKRLEEVEGDTNFMLSLMKHFHIVFPLPHDEDVFVAPQYLPKTPHKSTVFFKELLQVATHKYVYSGFFHKSVVQAFFHQYGQHAQTSQEKPVDADDYFFWRNGIIIKTPEHAQIVMVEFNPQEHATYIRPQDGDPNGPLVKEIMDCFTEIHKGRTVQQEVSVNGRDFVPLDELVDCATKGLPMLEVNGTLHRVANFSNFFPDNLKKNFMRKKLFISYSKHDLELIEELKAHLSPLKRNGEIETWYDHDIQAGANFNTEIENNLRSADIILLMISADFINTDYVWNKEIPLAFELEKKHPDKTVVPIILRHCDWTSLHHDLIEKNSPAKGKPIKSYADRDEGWTLVVKALKEVVRGNPVPQEPEKG